MKRNTSQRLTDDVRRTFSASGEDEPVVAWAAETSMSANEFQALIAAAPATIEGQLLGRLVVTRQIAYPDDLRLLRARLEAEHTRLLDQPFDDHDERQVEREGMGLLRWWAACDALLLAGTADAQERWDRLASTAGRGIAVGLLDDLIEASANADSPAAHSLRALFSRLRDEDHTAMESLEAIRPHFDGSRRGGLNRDMVFDHLVDVIVDKFILPRGYRRALLTLPAVTNYLRTAARHAAAQASEEPRAIEIIRTDLTADDADPVAMAEQRELLRAVQAEFLPSLPARIRADFVAVKLAGDRAVDVADRTNRSRAAVSKNLARANELLQEFLTARGLTNRPIALFSSSGQNARLRPEADPRWDTWSSKSRPMGSCGASCARTTPAKSVTF